MTKNEKEIKDVMAEFPTCGIQKRIFTIEVRDSASDIEIFEEMIAENQDRFQYINASEKPDIEAVIGSFKADDVLDCFTLDELLDNVKWRI